MRSFLGILALFCALAFSAPASATPSADGTCDGAGGSGTACPIASGSGGSPKTQAVTVTTTGGAGGCLVIFASNNTSSTSVVTVSSISQTGGTGTVNSFTKRASISGHGLAQYIDGGVDLEIWSASYLTTITNAVITVIWNNGTDNEVVAAFAAKGGVSNGCSWDSHAGVTFAGNFNSGIGSTVTQTTTQAHDLLFGAATMLNLLNVNASNTPMTFGGTGGSQSGGIQQSGGFYADNLGVFYLGVSSSGSISTIPKLFSSAGAFCTFNSNVCYGLGIADALTSDTVGGAAATNMLLLGVGP